jgi:hypothetical protein
MLNTNQVSNERNLWLNWTIAVSLGELVGFTIPAIAGAIAGWLLLSEFSLAALLVLAGAGEGAILATAQALVLRQVIPEFTGGRWILYTAIGAMIAWGLGMSASQLNNLENITLVIIGWIAIAAVLVCTIGFAQWLVLRDYFYGAGWWIPVNALAWMLGVLVPVSVLSLVPDDMPFAFMGLLAILSGAVMGVIVGTITGWMLARLAKNPR